MEIILKKHILIANGVNLDLLGIREPDIYGSDTLADIQKEIERTAPFLSQAYGIGLKMTFFQSNSESDFLAELSRQPWDGILINPAAWTHTSLAIADRLAAINVPYVEVHLSNLHSREDFRSRSYTAFNSAGVVSGMGKGSYTSGLNGLLCKLSSIKKIKTD